MLKDVLILKIYIFFFLVVDWLRNFHEKTKIHALELPGYDL